MAAAGLAVSDYHYSWLVDYLGFPKIQSISDNDYAAYNATAAESVTDARRRYVITNYGGLYSDSMSEINRKYYTAVLGVVPASDTNSDAEYNSYKSVAP